MHVEIKDNDLRRASPHTQGSHSWTEKAAPTTDLVCILCGDVHQHVLDDLLHDRCRVNKRTDAVLAIRPWTAEIRMWNAVLKKGTAEFKC